MQKFILLIGIYLLLVTNVFAAEPSSGWSRDKIDKIGFYSGDINQLISGNIFDVTDDKFDFIKTLNTLTYCYVDNNSSNIPDPVTFEVISDIPEGEYYIFGHVEIEESYNGEDWTPVSGISNVWLYGFSYNGWAVFNDDTRALNFENANFVKIRIQRDTQTNLVCTLLEIDYDSGYPPFISYLWSVNSSI